MPIFLLIFLVPLVHIINKCHRFNKEVFIFRVRKINREKLTLLKELEVQKNQLIEIPDSIGNLKQLPYLNLAINLIETLPTTIGDLRSLEMLNLLENKISFFPESIQKLNSLRYLNIKRNKNRVFPSFYQSLKERGVDIVDQ